MGISHLVFNPRSSLTCQKKKNARSRSKDIVVIDELVLSNNGGTEKG